MKSRVLALIIFAVLYSSSVAVCEARSDSHVIQILEQVTALTIQDMYMPIRIEKADQVQFKLEPDNLEFDKFISYAVDSGKLTLKQIAPERTSSSLSLNSNGSSISVTSSSDRGNSLVILNGKVVGSGDEQADKLELPDLLVIRVPSDTELVIHTHSVLESSATISKLDLNLEGAGHSELAEVSELKAHLKGAVKLKVQAAQSAEVSAEGSSAVELDNLGVGDLKVALRGASRLKGNGEFRNLSLDLDGVSRVELKGDVSDELRIKAQRLSRVRIEGKFSGEIYKDIDHSAQVVLR